MRPIRLAVLTLTFVAIAATPAAAQLRAGLIGGATYSTLRGRSITSADYSWGWFAGAYLELPYGANWALSIELDWVKKGGKAVAESGQAFDLDVGYVEVPVIGTFLLPLGAQWDAGLYGGFGVGVAITCDAAVGSASSVSCDNSLSSTKTEWMIPVGARLSYEVAGGQALTLDVRYTIPLSDALQAQPTTPETDGFKIHAWQFLARWSTSL